jgi:hypothetical protein
MFASGASLNDLGSHFLPPKIIIIIIIIITTTIFSSFRIRPHGLFPQQK